MPREDPRYKKKRKKKRNIYRRSSTSRKNFSFPLLSRSSTTSSPTCSSTARSGRSVWISLRGDLPLLQSNPIVDGWTKRRSRDFFFFLFLVVDTHRAAASQNSTRILVYKTNSETRNVRDLDRKDTIKDPKDFSSRSISSTFFLDVVPRGRATSRMAARRDHLSPPLCICVRFNFFSYKWKAD